MVKPMVGVLSHTRGQFWVWVLCVLGLVSLWGLPAVAQQTYTVTTTDDNTTDDSDCTLREAILAANNAPANGNCGAASTGDDTITFSVSGTIVLGSQLPNIVSAGTAGKLTIDGTGQSVTISGNNSVRVLEVNSGGDLTLKNLTVSNGSANFGGGVFNAGLLTITNSTLSSNSASFGGGIFNGSGGTVTLTNSTLSGNSASSTGGGIENGGTVTLTNSTLSGNSAGFGGGIRNNGTATLTNSTLSGNSAGLGGGIRNHGTLTLKNTIVANSTSGGNCANAGTFHALGVNFATDGTCPGFTNSTQLNLGPLANNGGPTQTHALLAGSVAIDAVSDCTPVTQDQRGVGRPQGARCDVGAFESNPARTLTVSKLGTGSGTVTDNLSEITCGGDCTGSYGHGAAVTLTATPSVGSTFDSWSGDCSGTSASTSVTMNADKTCTATFTLVYTLGDVNNDGKINTIDARMAQQHADGVITLTGTQFLAADVNTDNDVDSTDATAIAKKGIGLPTGIPGFAQLPPSPQPSPSQGEGLVLALLPLLVLVLRRSRRVATLLLAVGVLSTLSGCVEFAGLPPPGGPAIYLTSTSMPNGATRTIELRVQELTAQGGLASLQGRITFPAGVAIQSVTGQSGFVVKALCGTVSEPCSSPNELRFSIVKPSAGGVSTGVVLQLAVQASGGSGQVYTLSWSGSAQAPIVLGGDTNVEITGFSLGNGQVKVQ